jgi:hypothetical protein
MGKEGPNIIKKVLKGMNLAERKNNKNSFVQNASMEQLQLIPGIWVNGHCFWMQNQAEKVIYEEGLVMKVKQEQLHSRIRFSTVYVSNYSNQKKEVRILAMHQYPNPLGEQLTFVSPTDNRIFHLANKAVYMVNGQYNGIGMRDSTVMPQWNAFTDQIWSSLKKGILKYQPMVKGLAASIFMEYLTIESHETKKMNTWTIWGMNKNEVHSIEQALLKNTLAFPFEK